MSKFVREELTIDGVNVAIEDKRALMQLARAIGNGRRRQRLRPNHPCCGHNGRERPIIVNARGESHGQFSSSQNRRRRHHLL